MSTQVVAGGSQEGAGLSQTERVVDTFLAPTRTFTDILRSTSWWVPFLLLVLISTAATVVIDKRVGFDVVVQNTLRNSPKQQEAIEQLPPEQQTLRMHKMVVAYRYSGYFAPVLVLLVSAIGALVLLGSFNFGLGAKATFGQMFAVWMYASLPRLLGPILMAVTILAGGASEGFDVKNPVGTNLGFYVPDAAPWLRALLGYFDVLGIWSLVLLILGTAIVAKVKRSQAATVILGWWFLFMAVTVGAAAAFS